MWLQICSTQNLIVKASSFMFACHMHVFACHIHVGFWLDIRPTCTILCLHDTCISFSNWISALYAQCYVFMSYACSFLTKYLFCMHNFMLSCHMNIVIWLACNTLFSLRLARSCSNTTITSQTKWNETNPKKIIC